MKDSAGARSCRDSGSAVCATKFGDKKSRSEDRLFYRLENRLTSWLRPWPRQQGRRRRPREQQAQHPQEQGRQRLWRPRWQRAQAAAEAARPQVLLPEPEGEEGGLPCRSPLTSARQAQKSVLSGSFLGSFIDKLSGIWRGPCEPLQADNYTLFCRRFTGRWWSRKRRGTNCPRFPKSADICPGFPCRRRG